jgi:hypothetical protein
MIEHEGKLYVVYGSTLARVDVKTLNIEAKVDLSKLGAAADADEQAKKQREEWLAQFDTDKNGEISGQELENNRWLRGLDRNQDGKITADEVPTRGRPAPGASGEAVLLVKDAKLYMLRGGMIFAFDLNTLEAGTSVKVAEEEQQQPGVPFGGRGGRGGGPGGAGGPGGGGRGGRGGQGGGEAAPGADGAF